MDTWLFKKHAELTVSLVESFEQAHGSPASMLTRIATDNITFAEFFDTCARNNIRFCYVPPKDEEDK